MGNLTQAMLTADNDLYFADHSTNIATTYQQVTATKNYATGAVTEVIVTTTIYPGVSEVDEVLVASSGGRYKLGDRIFRCKTSELPESPPLTTSRIVHGGVTFNIIRHLHSADALVTDIQARDPLNK